jgi:hypothetical protein
MLIIKTYNDFVNARDSLLANLTVFSSFTPIPKIKTQRILKFFSFHGILLSPFAFHHSKRS